METKLNSRDTSTCADSKPVCSALAASPTPSSATPAISATCGPLWTSCQLRQSPTRSMIRTAGKDSSASCSWISGSISVRIRQTTRTSHKIKMLIPCPMPTFSRYLRMHNSQKMFTSSSKSRMNLMQFKKSRKWLVSMFLCGVKTCNACTRPLKEMSIWLKVSDANHRLRKNKLQMTANSAAAAFPRSRA